MQLLTAREAESWKARHSVVKRDLPASGQEEMRESSSAFRIRADGIASDVAGLAYMLTLTGSADYDESQFPGAILLLKRWEVWSESIDRIGTTIMESLRLSDGAGHTLDEAPAMRFSSAEFVQASSALLIPLLFQWDAEFAVEGGKLRMNISHDGWIDIFPSSEVSLDTIAKRFAAWSVR
jgi:hypothetical protein